VISVYVTRVDVLWSTDRFKSVKFEVAERIEHPWGDDRKVPYRELFRKLRVSLSLGLNPKARDAANALMHIDKDKPHPIHRMIRTSRSL
jgi:hypothetical protein